MHALRGRQITPLGATSCFVRGERTMPYDQTTAIIMQLVPLMTIQLFYAWLVFVLCRKQHWNWGWALAALVPLLGIFVFAVVFVTTWFNTLDRLNKLEGKA